MTRSTTLLGLTVLIGGTWLFTRPPAPLAIRAVQAAAPESAVARGRIVYERYGCILCHGKDATGGLANPNALRGGKIPSLTEVGDTYTAAEIAQVIRFGRVRIDRADEKGPIPPYRMPGWGNRISNQDVNDLVQYVLSLYKGSKKKGWS